MTTIISQKKRICVKLQNHNHSNVHIAIENSLKMHAEIITLKVLIKLKLFKISSDIADCE